MPSCSQPSRTLRAAEAVARSRAIVDRRCARRKIARAGRDGRMVQIEQKDWTEEDRASKLGQNHPLDSTKRRIWKSSLGLYGANSLGANCTSRASCVSYNTAPTEYA